MADTYHLVNICRLRPSVCAFTFTHQASYQLIIAHTPGEDYPDFVLDDFCVPLQDDRFGKSSFVLCENRVYTTIVLEWGCSRGDSREYQSEGNLNLGV